jgi:hypothetical protein
MDPNSPRRNNELRLTRNELFGNKITGYEYTMQEKKQKCEQNQTELPDACPSIGRGVGRCAKLGGGKGY